MNLKNLKKLIEAVDVVKGRIDSGALVPGRRLCGIKSQQGYVPCCTNGHIIFEAGAVLSSSLVVTPLEEFLSVDRLPNDVCRLLCAIVDANDGYGLNEDTRRTRLVEKLEDLKIALVKMQFENTIRGADGARLPGDAS